MRNDSRRSGEALGTNREVDWLLHVMRSAAATTDHSRDTHLA